MLSANLSGLLPASVLGVLHASRLEGGTIGQLRSQVAEIELESQRVRRENNLLLQRFALTEQANSEVTRRVGALEVSVPQLLEQQIRGPEIDRAMTGSIGGGEVLSFDTEGGSVRVQQKPLLPAGAVKTEITGLAARQAADPISDPDAFGLALGFPVSSAEAEVQWQGLTAKVGTLLLGMTPLLATVDGSDAQQIVAGPLMGRTEADELCGRMDRVGIPCEPVPFVGTALPLLN